MTLGCSESWPSKGYGHVCLDVVLSHVAGGSTVDYQELHHLVHVACQVDGYCYRLLPVYRRLFGYRPSGGFPILDPDHEGTEVGSQVGIPQVLLVRNLELVFLVPFGLNGRDRDAHGQHQHQ